MTAQKRVLTTAWDAVCAGKSAALATIVHIQGSSSMPLATRMVVLSDATFVGSVSDGCVEHDVARRAAEVLSDGQPRIASYHQVTDPVMEVGLNCPGSVRILIEAADRQLVETLRTSSPGRLVTRVDILEGGFAAIRRSVIRTEEERSGNQRAVDMQPHSSEESPGTIVLTEPLGLRNRLLVFGATDVAVVLADLAARVGFAVTICDPRVDYAVPGRFPGALDVVAAWPTEALKTVRSRGVLDAATFVVSLNHEPRFEDALFVALMDHEAPRYIGAIGRKGRQAEREARQAEAGFDLSRLPRIHSPIGIDIGGKSPEDIAVSILAEIIAVRNGRD